MKLLAFLFSRQGLLLVSTSLFVVVVFFYVFRLSLPSRSVAVFRLPESGRIFTGQGVVISPMAFPVGSALWPGEEVQVFSNPLELVGSNRNHLLQITGLLIPWQETDARDRQALKASLLPAAFRFQSLALLSARCQLAPGLEGILEMRADRQPSGALNAVGHFRMPASRLDFSARVGWDSLEEFITVEGTAGDAALARHLLGDNDSLPLAFWELLPPLKMRAQALLDPSLGVRSRVVLAEASQPDFRLGGAGARTFRLSAGLVGQANHPPNLHWEAGLDHLTWENHAWWKIWAVGRQNSGGPHLIDLGWEAEAVGETVSRLRLEIEEDTSDGQRFALRTVRENRAAGSPLARGNIAWDANGRLLVDELQFGLGAGQIGVAALTIAYTPDGLRVQATGLRVDGRPLELPPLLIGPEGFFRLERGVGGSEEWIPLPPAELPRLLAPAD